MKILVFGDSIAQGRSDPEYFGWVNRLAIWTQQEAIRTDWQVAHLVCNMGNAGDTSTDVAERFSQEFIWRRGGDDALVLFQVGINDAAHTGDTGNNVVRIEKTVENVNKLMTEAKELVATVVVLGLTAVDESKVNRYIDSPTGRSWVNQNITTYDAAIREITNRHGVLFIPMQDVVPSTLCDDGLHPNSEGHRLIFERVKGELEKAGIL